jgi:hypothetical protein
MRNFNTMNRLVMMSREGPAGQPINEEKL